MATRFKVRVPPSRRVTLPVPVDVEPGEAEVILLHRRTKPARTGTARPRSQPHPAFGLWATRPEAADPVTFVDDLRRRTMERRVRLRDAP